MILIYNIVIPVAAAFLAAASDFCRFSISSISARWRSLRSPPSKPPKQLPVMKKIIFF